MLFELLRFHPCGFSVLPGTILKYVWHAGRGDIWNGVLLAASPELVDELDATEFNAWKLNAKETIPPKLVEILKPQIEHLTLFEEIRFKNSTLTKILPKLKANSDVAFLENQTEFTNNKARIRCTSV